MPANATDSNALRLQPISADALLSEFSAGVGLWKPDPFAVPLEQVGFEVEPGRFVYYLDPRMAGPTSAVVAPWSIELPEPWEDGDDSIEFESSQSLVLMPPTRVARLQTGHRSARFNMRFERFGKTEVAATYRGQRCSVEVEVAKAPVFLLQVTPPVIEMEAGQSVPVTVVLSREAESDVSVNVLAEGVEFASSITIPAGQSMTTTMLTLKEKGPAMLRFNYSTGVSLLDSFLDRSEMWINRSAGARWTRIRRPTAPDAADNYGDLLR